MVSSINKRIEVICNGIFQIHSRARKLENILSAQDAMGTILIYEAKSFQCQMNRKVNMMKVNEVIGIPEGLESNAIELLEMIRETTPGKCFALYFGYCSASD